MNTLMAQRIGRGALLGLALTLALGAATPGTPVHAQSAPGATGPLTAQLVRHPAGPQAVAGDNWTNPYPGLTEVSAVSAKEAWAVGDYGHVLHYTGGAWQKVDPPALKGYPLTDIQMLSATDGWVAGGWGAFQYKDGTWRDRSAGLSTDVQLTRLSVLADNDVWGVGFRGSDRAAEQNRQGLIFHWDGTTWAQQDAGIPPSDYFTDIAMTASGEGWAVGWWDAVGQSPMLYHRTNGTWQRFFGPNGADGWGAFARVAATGDGDAWISGEDDGNNQLTPYIYHWHNGTWTGFPTPAQSWVRGLVMLSTSDGWASGESGVLHWDGAAWTRVYSGRNLPGLAAVPGQVWSVGGEDSILSLSGGAAPVLQRGGPTTAYLYGISAVNGDEAWAVGDAGLILHYKAGVAQVVSTPIHQPLYAVQMLSATDGYAVGGIWNDPQSGIIAHWDGVRWTQTVTGFGALYALAMTGPGEGWAVGNDGQLWHAHNGAWTRSPNFYGGQLSGIAMDSPTHGWAVGRYSSSPTLLEYSNGTWTPREDMPRVHSLSLNGIALVPGGQEGWAVGNFYDADHTGRHLPLLHLHNGTWTAESVGGTDLLTAVAVDPAGTPWAAGPEGLYHLVNGTWQTVEYASNYGLSALAFAPDHGAFGVDWRATLLRYNGLEPGQLFYDVRLSDSFAPYINALATRGIVGGYADGTFKPGATTSRAQLAKMIVTGLGWTITSNRTGTFADVPPGSTYYAAVETAAARGLLTGYTCGGPGEPCDATKRPYFRPGTPITRAQLATVLVRAKGWTPRPPAGATFADVPATSGSYAAIETAAAHGLLTGYACGGPTEICPGSYFRPAAPATRAQVSKLLYLALSAP